jgi:hypothetical protein
MKKLPAGMPDALLAVSKQLLADLRSQSKSAAGRAAQASSATGALLLRKRETVSRSWSPLLDDEYAKRNENDLLGAHRELLAVASLRIAAAIRGFKEPFPQPQPFSDEWMPLLCALLDRHYVSFAHGPAKQLAKLLSPSVVRYHVVRDEFTLARLLRKVSKLAAASRVFTEPLPYESSVKLVELLSAVAKITQKRPLNWEAYCVNKPDILTFIYETAFRLNESTQHDAMEILSCFVRLLAGALHPTGESKPKQESEAKKAAAALEEKLKKGAEDAADIAALEASLAPGAKKLASRFIQDPKILEFVLAFVVRSRSKEVRTEAGFFVTRLWEHGTPEDRRTLSGMLWKGMESVPEQGRNAAEFMAVMSTAYAVHAEDHTAGTEERVVALLRRHNRMLERHPNASLYRGLTRVLDLDGYLLETEPCLVCNDTEAAF